MNIESTLRRAIRECGKSVKRISEESGICRINLLRFLHDQHAMSIKTADKLAAYFGLRMLEPGEGTFSVVQEKRDKIASK